MGFQKNVVGQKWRVFAFDRTDNSPAISGAAQITSKIAVDYGTRTASNDTYPDELEDGYYEFDLTQGETNGDVLDIYPESSTDDIQVIGVPGRSFTVPSAFAATAMRGTDSAATATNLATVATNLATVDGIVDDILVDTGTTLPGTITTIDGIVDNILVDTETTIPATITALQTDATAIVADTNELQLDWVNGGRLDQIVDAILVDTGTTIPATITTIDGIVDNILVDTGTTIPGTITALQTDATAIVADTNELQTDDVPGLIAALNDPSVATIADAVWDETQSGHVSVGSFGIMASEIADILVDTGTTIPGTITAIEALALSIKTTTAAIQTDTTEIGVAGAGLTDLGGMSTGMKSEVNAEAVDVLRTDTATELSATPAASPSLHSMVQLIYMAVRNEYTSTASASTIRNNAGTAIGTSSDSDDGTTFSRGKHA